MTKLEIMYNWMKACPSITNWLYFNAIRMEDNEVTLNTISDVKTAKYANGSSENDFVFEINFIQKYDTEQSNSNLRGMEETLEIADWIESQTVLPNFGANYEANGFEIDEHIPTQVIDQELGLCAYKFQVRFKYSKY